MHRSLTRLAGLCACVTPLLTLAQLPARAAAAPAAQQRERIELVAAPTPDWLERALRHGSGGLPPLPPTDDPHASALTVELVVVTPARGAALPPREGLVVEVLIPGRDANDLPWTAVARVAADGTAAFARVPEGRPHVLVLAPDAARVPLVPDPARYGLLFEPFSGGPFPHLALDELATESGARVVQLHLVPGRAADGIVELDAVSPPALDTRRGEVPPLDALAWVASPGWLQLAPLDASGAFRWFDPRAAPATPFDPSAPSAGFLERLTGGVARPYGVSDDSWRACNSVPAPPVGHTFVIEVTTEESVQRARGAEHTDASTTSSIDSGAELTATEAALARWRALRATPLAPKKLAPRALSTPTLTRAERVALASALLHQASARKGVAQFIAEACRWELEPARSAVAQDPLFRPLQLFLLVREWLALGGEGSEETELALLDRAEPPIKALLETSEYSALHSEDVPLQLWIDVVAPRYPGYAEALAAFRPALRAPRRATARGNLPQDVAELDSEDLHAALRKRPSSTLGAELAPLVQSAPRDTAQRLLAGFAALARDDTRGPAARAGAVDLLLALGARPAGDGSALAELVLAALGDEPSDVARTDAVLAALAPLAPARALDDARAALDVFARTAAANADRDWLPPMGALLVLGVLAPAELAQRAEATPCLVEYAVAALLLDGRDALDARGLPQAFLERLLR